MAFGLGIDFALYVFINEKFPQTVTINKVCGIESKKICSHWQAKGTTTWSINSGLLQ